MTAHMQQIHVLRTGTIQFTEHQIIQILYFSHLFVISVQIKQLDECESIQKITSKL